MSDSKTENGNQDSSIPSKAHARAAADEMPDFAAEAAREFRGRAEDVAVEWREKARDAQKEIESYVRENPARSVLAAVGIGFVIGLIVRR